MDLLHSAYSGLPESSTASPPIWGTYGDHSYPFLDFPQYPSFSLGDTVVCGLLCRFQLFCSVSRVETVVQQPAQQKEASSRPFAVPKRCQDASWGRKQCISQLAPLHVLLSRPKVLGRKSEGLKVSRHPLAVVKEAGCKDFARGILGNLNEFDRIVYRLSLHHETIM